MKLIIHLYYHLCYADTLKSPFLVLVMVILEQSQCAVFMWQKRCALLVLPLDHFWQRVRAKWSASVGIIRLHCLDLIRLWLTLVLQSLFDGTVSTVDWWSFVYWAWRWDKEKCESWSNKMAWCCPHRSNNIPRYNCQCNTIIIDCLIPSFFCGNVFSTTTTVLWSF